MCLNSGGKWQRTKFFKFFLEGEKWQRGKMTEGITVIHKLIHKGFKKYCRKDWIKVDNQTFAWKGLLNYFKDVHISSIDFTKFTIDYDSKMSGYVLENICIFILCSFRRKIEESSNNLEFELKAIAYFYNKLSSKVMIGWEDKQNLWTAFIWMLTEIKKFMKEYIKIMNINKDWRFNDYDSQELK